MTDTLRAGVIGCGDFLRWQQSPLGRSARFAVHAVTDPRHDRAAHFAAAFGARVHPDAAALIADPEIDVVLLFVPPWLRADPLVAALEAGKHVIATKPLAASEADCDRIRAAVRATQRRCGLLYNRSDSAFVHTCRRIFDQGEIGGLALYKQDWLHHYPQWNDWATDPEKNGGPFMDAMIHNLNAARFLAGRDIERATLFSDRLVQDIPCADTEMLKVDFVGGGGAQLFITWAAELATWSRQGNDREHIDQCFLVSDQGWYLTQQQRGQRDYLCASRRGEERWWPLQAPEQTVYDGFAEHLAGTAPWPSGLIGIDEAWEDVVLLRRAGQAIGRAVDGPLRCLEPQPVA